MLSAFDYRNNSIGFLRFLFASIVIWSHAFPLGGFGLDPIDEFSRHREAGGTLAVAGFFLLSGFLITRSYESGNGLAAFLRNRALRILPAFYVCLIAVAFGFAPLAYRHDYGTFAGFMSEQPWNYVLRNALLYVAMPNVGTLLSNNPYPTGFNGSLWTLVYEFGCYVAIGLAGVTGMLSRNPRMIAAVTVAIGAMYVAASLQLFPATSSGFLVMQMVTYFFIGSCAYLFRDAIPMRGRAAAGFAVLAAAAIATPLHALVLPVCLSYVVLYVAMKWPIRSFDRRIDLSYGMYIYAFPVAQLAVVYGLNANGLAEYLALTFPAVMVLAAASWYCIERPALSFKARAA